MMNEKQIKELLEQAKKLTDEKEVQAALIIASSNVSICDSIKELACSIEKGCKIIFSGLVRKS